MPSINPAGNDGLLYGNPSLLVTQLIAVGATIAFTAAGSAVILLALKVIMGLRVTPEEERLGLDLSQHSETAYVLASDYDEVSSAHSSVQIPAGAKMHSQNA